MQQRVVEAAAASPSDAATAVMSRPLPRHAAPRAYSGSVAPLPPKSFGKSLNFGRPSFTASTFSP